MNSGVFIEQKSGSKSQRIQSLKKREPESGY
jgi:hypothetical protein